MSELRLVWRDYNPEDDARWVLKSWLTSYMTSREVQAIDRDVYFAAYHPLVSDCIQRSETRIVYDEEVGADAIVGWRCMSRDGSLLHYVHVRNRWRKLGVAKWMLAGMYELDGAYTHAPPMPASRLLGDGWRYEPWRRLASKEKEHHGKVSRAAER